MTNQANLFTLLSIIGNKSHQYEPRPLLPRLLPFNFCLLIFAFCLLPFAAVAATESLPDPTRPPASLSLGQQDVTKFSGPVLQSVMISLERRVAIISGQTVKLGEKFGNAEVIKISEGEVVLRSGKDLQILKLFPNIEKLPASSGADIKAQSRAQKGQVK